MLCICSSATATSTASNDDVQGTAGITLAGMIKATKLKGSKLKDEKYLFLGAGSALPTCFVRRSWRKV